MTDYFDNASVEVLESSRGEVDICVSLVSSNYNFELINRAINYWKKSGELGAFNILDSSLRDNSLVLEQKTYEVSNSCWRLLLMGHDMRCLVVLANMIIDVGYTWDLESEIISSSLELVTIKTTDKNEKFTCYDYRDESIFNEEYYPQLSKHLTANVVFDTSSAPNSYRRMILELHNNATDKIYEEVVKIVSLWGKLVKGGYPTSSENLINGSCYIGDISIDVFDEVTLEIKIAEFGGVESAWYSLVSMIDRCLKVRCITIY